MFEKVLSGIKSECGRELMVDDVVETILECPVCEHTIRGVIEYDAFQGTFVIDFLNDGFKSPIANFIEVGMTYLGNDRENLGIDNPLFKNKTC